MSMLPAAVIAPSVSSPNGIIVYPRPILQSGKMILPEHCRPRSAAVTLTAARYYFVPITLDKIETFAGTKCQTSGTADNGFKYKMAIYEESASGGAGALAKNFGEVTADNTAAIRTFASSWTNTKLGIYYLAFASDSAAHLFAMTSGSTTITNVGYQAPGTYAVAKLPVFSSDLLASDGNTGAYIGDYVAGTYANFPESTALATTNSIVAENAFPAIGLYK